MDLDNVRINSGKIFRNGEFNAQESLYWSNIYVGDAVREVTEQLKDINKNLEKIANNTEKQDKVSIPTIQAIGNFFAEETKKIKEADINTIICNQNKDSHVDKNIILD